MCEYCERYGDGTFWYLNPKNYGRQLYRRARQGYVPDAISYRQDRDKLWFEYFEAVADESPQAEELRQKLDNLIQANEPCQVAPLSDCLKLAEVAQPLVSMSCICRKQMRAADERSPLEYTCGGLGVGLLKWERWPERYRGGVKFVNVDESKKWARDMNKRGFVPIIMIYGERFVGGICMCDYPACDAIAGRLDFGWHCLKGHYVAIIEEDKCNGCGICAQRCQWGALKFNVTTGKAGIDQFRCFGCGLCETACPQGAIYLEERVKVPALKEAW